MSLDLHMLPAERGLLWTKKLESLWSNLKPKEKKWNAYNCKKDEQTK